MQETISNAAIVGFLKEKFRGAGFIDSLKIKYRSYICPFADLISQVKPGEKVGDIGCGSGQFLLLVSHFAQPSFMYGIEITQRLIDNAKDLFSTLPSQQYDFSTFDGSHFPAKLGEMDVLFLIDVIHHVPKNLQENFIKGIAEVMKPGARLVFKDINAANPLVYCNKVHDMIFAREIGNEMSMSRAKNLLQQNGLQIIEENKRTMYVYPHYTLIAKK